MHTNFIREFYFIKLCKYKMENFENDLVNQSYNKEGKVVKQIFTTESDSAEPSSPVPERVEGASDSHDSEANPDRRASVAVSRFSSMIDPNIISSWLSSGIGYGSQAARTRKRATVIDHSSVKSGFVSLRAPDGVDFSMFNDEISDDDLPREFENFLVCDCPYYCEPA